MDPRKVIKSLYDEDPNKLQEIKRLLEKLEKDHQKSGSESICRCEQVYLENMATGGTSVNVPTIRGEDYNSKIKFNQTFKNLLPPNHERFSLTAKTFLKTLRKFLEKTP